MKFDQCLFGYEDGHRLLASSLPLGSETSLLTELSDLAPGAVFRQSEGYWTGLPAPALGRYVLMRTWPAPEMSRPGCVWTHALLIELKFLESLDDLSVLQSIPVRPTPILNRNYYREPLSVDLHLNAPRIRELDEAMVKRLLASLYADGDKEIEVSSPGDLDDALFAVWSQQWPRLRRNMRFQTAASSTPRSSRATRFDITTILASKTMDASKGDVIDMEWLTDAALDIQSGISGTLRQFLLTYGRDVRKQRGSFRPLVEIHAISNRERAQAGQNVIELVSSAFPSADDAKTLKQDLVNGALVASAQPEILHFVISSNEPALFPAPDAHGITRLPKLWPKKKNELLRLAEITASDPTDLSKSIFEVITNCVPRAQFWEATCSYPHIRKNMLALRPDLFVAEEAIALDDATVASVLALIPEETLGMPEFISQLLSRDNDRLAKVAFERFPSITAAQVLSTANTMGNVIAPPWWRELKRKPKLFIQNKTLSKISRASLLYEVANSIGWITPEVIRQGPGPWLLALKRASFDLWEDKADTFNCFILALALKSQNDDAREAIEKTFDSVHGKILKSKLYWRGEELLLPLLPDLGWMSNWNVGLRLRTAVATAYIDSEWPTSSFALLTPNKKVRLMLAETAADLPGGYSYSQAAKY